MDDRQLIAEINTYLTYPEVQFDEAMLMLGRLVPVLLARYSATRNDLHVALEEVRRLQALRCETPGTADGT